MWPLSLLRDGDPPALWAMAWDQCWKDLTGIAWPIYAEHVLAPERRQREKVRVILTHVTSTRGWPLPK